MKNFSGRALAVLTCAWLAMVMMALTAPLAMRLGNKWAAIGTAAAMMVAAIPLHLAAGKCKTKGRSLFLWGMCYFLNSAANGFSAAALYLHGEISITSGELLVGMLPAGAIMLCASVLCIAGRKKLALWMGGLLTAALIVASLFPQVWEAQPQRSAMCLAALVAGMYLVALGLLSGERSCMRTISLVSFGAMMLVAFAVLVIISEGDILDGLDVSGDWPAKKKKQRL